MTIRELSQITRIRKEIMTEQAVLEYMKSTISIQSTNEAKEKNLKAMQQTIDTKIDFLTAEIIRIQDYIYTIDDSLARDIMLTKFVQGLSWKQTADKIGGGNTVDSIRKIVYRATKKTDNKKS